MRNELFYKTLGVSIKEYRTKKGYSQEKLADRLGVTRSAVGNWEQGIREINVKEVLSICDILGITLQELIQKAEKYLWK